MPVPDLCLHTPARVVRQYLAGAFPTEYDPDPSQPNPWQVYYGKLRAEGTPDDAIGVTDTTPVKDGRAMRGGEVQYHYGVQILVRSRDQEAGYVKCVNLERYLSQHATGQTVTIDGTDYRIEGFSVTAGTTFVGEEEKTERQFHSLNGKIAYRIT